MLICLQRNYKNKAIALKKIRNLLKKEELFDETKLEIIKTVIKNEIKNLLSPAEQKEIKEEIELNTKTEDKIQKAIDEVNEKVLAETREKGIEEGIESVARNLKGKMDIHDIAQSTGLTISQIEKL